MKAPRWLVLPVLLLLGLGLDFTSHWHPCLRGAWDFLPASAGGMENEFLNVWLAEFARELRRLPFRETLWLLNPRPYGDYYSTHPGLLSGLAAAAQALFGEAPFVLRRLALGLFLLRLGFLFALLRRHAGEAAGWTGLALYLLIPATRSYPLTLSFELSAGTLLLGAFLWAGSWPAPGLAALAVLCDWTVAPALPFLHFAAGRGRRGAVLFGSALAALLFSFLWTRAHPGLEEAGPLLTRLVRFLSGPFHSLPGNPAAQAQLLGRLHESFPFFVLLPACFALSRNGAGRRPHWLRACLFSGLTLLLGFLGVFRAHSYLSALLALPFAALAAEGLLLAWRERRRALVALFLPLLLYETLSRPGFPAPRTEQALARCELRREAEALAPLARGRSARLLLDESSLRGKPYQLYLPATRMLLRPGLCAELVLRLKQERSSAGGCPLLDEGRLLALEEDCRCQGEGSM